MQMGINWISVRERLPQHEQEVLFKIGGSRLFLDHVKADGRKSSIWNKFAGKFVRSDKITNQTGPLGYMWRTFGMDRFKGHEVTHWAELND